MQEVYLKIALEINSRLEEFVFTVDSLIAALMELRDSRDTRSLRYALVTVLVFLILAKLLGEVIMRGVAEWIVERKKELVQALGFAQVQTPHYTTLEGILGYTVDLAQL